MRNNKNNFFHELTPLANKIRKITKMPPKLSEAKDVPAIMEKRSKKLERRLEFAKKAGQLK